MHIIPCKLHKCHLSASSPLMIFLLHPLFISILIPNILLPLFANKYLILAGHFVSSILTYYIVMHHWLVTQPLLFSPLKQMNQSTSTSSSSSPFSPPPSLDMACVEFLHNDITLHAEFHIPSTVLKQP